VNDKKEYMESESINEYHSKYHNFINYESGTGQRHGVLEIGAL
jgi:hypothetical protein